MLIEMLALQNTGDLLLSRKWSHLSPPELLMAMRCSLLVALSLADTCKMPSASISNET